MSHLKIWTDGACFPNPGNGGWAWCTEDGRNDSGPGGERTTNQRMEMTAVIRAIEAHEGPRPLLIITDSQYVIKGATSWVKGWIRNGWVNSQGKPVVNRDLWDRIVELTSRNQVSFSWVKGHSGDPMNEKADRLAAAHVGLSHGDFNRNTRKIKQGEIYSA